jgi:2',3'-cyclic-nucleotide 2'-phosphodiesterase
VNLLFIGDIFGKTGRDLLQRALPPLVERYEIALVIANAENSAGGFGVTRETGDGILKAGVDVMTSGNHVWDKKEALEYITLEPRLLRPANYPHGVPGCGALIARTAHGDEVGILNVMGRVFMVNIDDPFRVAEREVEKLRARTPIILVDMHAEATSEKLAMGWFLNGKVSAVVGTHTHVQTADDQILPGGTAYITDVGMTGPHDGIIGVERDPVINRFLTGLPARFEAASGNPKLHAVVITADAQTGRATAITRLSLTKAAIEEMQRGK